MKPQSPVLPRHIYWMSLALCVLALLPISMGALVTTLKAGMAFADWPTSDGQNMLLYPWLQDLSNPDKFTEHGHRLAGMLLGLFSIAFLVAVFRTCSTLWLRRYSIAILLAVIAQGLLGGARVLLDRQTLAMAHSISGAVFFCLCVGCVLGTSTRWRTLRRQHSDPRLAITSFAAGLLLPVITLGQYVLGSCFRHLHYLLDEHIAGAVLVSSLSLFVAIQLMRSSIEPLRFAGRLLIVTILLQVGLGLGAYVTRLGLPSAGYVAKSGSLVQSIVCSGHTVGGMLLLSSSVVSAAILLKLAHLRKLTSVVSELALPAGLELQGASRADGGVA